MALNDELEKFGGETHIDQFARPLAYSVRNPPRLADPFERLAERFMEGLKSQVDQLSKGLKENQQLLMYCYHGVEKLRVLAISMPNVSVVSMRCIDADGRENYVTGHLHAVTFSFVIDTIVSSEGRRPVGFTMP